MRSMTIALAVLLFAQSAAPADTAAPAEPAVPAAEWPPRERPRLDLVCEGSTVVGGGLFGGPRVPRSYAVRFRMADGAAAIRFPNDGITTDPASWEPVRKLRVARTEITGEVKAALFGYSRFVIDRVAGTISTSGGYSGTCRPVAEDRPAF